MTNSMRTMSPPLMVRAINPAALVCVGFIGAAATNASAVITNIFASPQLHASSAGAWSVMYVFAQGTSSSDNVIDVFDANISLTGSVSSFFNGSIQPGVLPPSGGAPLTGLDFSVMPQMLGDSFVTIGNDQTAAINTTMLDRGFDDAAFLSAGSIGRNAGWFNSDPANGQGLLGDDHFLLLGHFSIPFTYGGANLPHLNISSLNLTYTTGPFGGTTQVFSLSSPMSVGYTFPSPGGLAVLAMAGALTAQRRRSLA